MSTLKPKLERSNSLKSPGDLKDSLKVSGTLGGFGVNGTKRIGFAVSDLENLEEVAEEKSSLNTSRNDEDDLQLVSINSESEENEEEFVKRLT